VAVGEKNTFLVPSVTEKLLRWCVRVPAMLRQCYGRLLRTSPNSHITKPFLYSLWK